VKLSVFIDNSSFPSFLPSSFPSLRIPPSLVVSDFSDILRHRDGQWIQLVVLSTVF
jgi:hypothetical protein